MKLAVSTYSLWRWRKENNKTLEETIDWLADNGIGAVEFTALPGEMTDEPLRRAEILRHYAQKRGLEIAGYCVGGELLVPRAKQNQAVDQLKRDVDFGDALGVKTLRHDVTRGFGDHSKGLRGPKSFANALKVIVPAIREVADYAQSKGIRTSLENHGFYMQASERVEKLIRAVKHPNFGLTIDMGNFLCVNEDPVKAVKRLAKYAIMAHVKDFHVRPKADMPPSGWFATPTPIALRGAIVGHGVIDVPQQLRLLKHAGYDGFLSLEFEGMEEPTQAVKLGVEYLKKELAALMDGSG